MQDWSIEYEIVDRRLNGRDVIRRTASFKSRRWNRDAPNRDVIVFGVSRTVPANERTELIRCTSAKFAVDASRITAFSRPLQEAVTRILGKDVTRFQSLAVDSTGRVTLLTGVTPEGHGYSEFHFGAGESSIIRMVAQIEAGPEQTLVLIEEIENGLHPVATIRLVEYLIEVAERKKIQVIFTTHSNDSLKPLPAKAIWVATQDRVFQGKLDVSSLRAITGQIETAGVIFVEDAFAKIWMEAIIRQTLPEAFDRIQVHAMEGDGTAVAMNKYHLRNPTSRFSSICVIDGDSRQDNDDDEKVFRLPGESPEAHIFDTMLDVWDAWGGKLSVAMLQKFEGAQNVLKICQEVRYTNRDPHLLFSQVGERLGLVPENTISAAFANVWAQAYHVDAGIVADYVKQMLEQKAAN